MTPDRIWLHEHWPGALSSVWADQPKSDQDIQYVRITPRVLALLIEASDDCNACADAMVMAGQLRRPSTAAMTKAQNAINEILALAEPTVLEKAQAEKIEELERENARLTRELNNHAAFIIARTPPPDREQP